MSRASDVARYLWSLIPLIRPCTIEMIHIRRFAVRTLNSLIRRPTGLWGKSNSDRYVWQMISYFPIAHLHPRIPSINIRNGAILTPVGSVNHRRDAYRCDLSEAGVHT